MKNSRFPALSFFSGLLIGIGWALILRRQGKIQDATCSSNELRELQLAYRRRKLRNVRPEPRSNYSSAPRNSNQGVIYFVMRVLQLAFTVRGRGPIYSVATQTDFWSLSDTAVKE